VVDRDALIAIAGDQMKGFRPRPFI
jgi:hypothetical protein